jgi:hypothetical protein
MTKTEMIGRLMHSTGFNSNLDECIAFAGAQLQDVAGSPKAFRAWDTQVPDDFAGRYISDRQHVREVFWEPLYRELADDQKKGVR